MYNSQYPLCRVPFENMDMIEKRTTVKAITDVDKEKSIPSPDACEISVAMIMNIPLHR